MCTAYVPITRARPLANRLDTEKCTSSAGAPCAYGGNKRGRPICRPPGPPPNNFKNRDARARCAMPIWRPISEARSFPTYRNDLPHHDHFAMLKLAIFFVAPDAVPARHLIPSTPLNLSALDVLHLLPIWMSTPARHSIPSRLQRARRRGTCRGPLDAVSLSARVRSRLRVWTARVRSGGVGLE